MKKFYSLLAAAAIVASASAAAPREISLTTEKLPVAASELAINKTAAPKQVKARGHNLNLANFNKPIRSMQEITAQSDTGTAGMARMSSTKNMRLLQARKVDGTNSVEGTWTFDLGDYYFQSSVNGQIHRTFEATLEDNEIWFEDPSGSEFPFAGIYDASASTITFPPVGMGTVKLQDGSSVYVKQQPFKFNAGNLYDINALVGQFSASAGTLSFTSDQGLEWQALASESATELLGYFAIYDFEGAKLKNAGGGTGGGGTTAGTGLEGTWEWTFIDDMLSSSTGEQLTVTYVCSYEEDYDDYFFEDPTDYELPFFVYYDDATGEVTLPMDILGSAGQYYVGQIGFEPNYATGNLETKDEIYFSYDSAKGEMVFQPDSGILWPAIDPSSSQIIGYFAGYSFVSAVNGGGGNGGGTTPEPGDGDSDWTDIGNATLMDGWVLPCFGIDQTNPDNWYEVPMQQSKTNPNMYRLVNPYMYGPAAEYNTHATKQGYIQFDISDPDHVMFSTVESGFAYKDVGVTKMYCMNELTFLVDYYGSTPEDIISVLGDQIPYTYYEDGIVELSYILDDDGPWYDACFGLQNDPTGGYQWQDQQGVTVDMSAAIFFPAEGSGVSTIAPEEEGQAIYFNLQGVRVANPEKGQLLIVRKGNKVEKVLHN